MNSFTRFALGLALISFAFPGAAFAANTAPSVTVLVKGSSGEVRVADGDSVKVSWTSEKGRNCQLEYPSKKGEVKKSVGNQGHATLRVYPSVKEETEVHFSCLNTKTGAYMFDSVHLELPVAATQNVIFKLNAPSAVKVGEKYEISWEEGRYGSIYERMDSFPHLKGKILLTHTDSTLGIGQTVVEKLSARNFGKEKLTWKVGKKTNDGRPLPSGIYEMVMYLENSSKSKILDGAIAKSVPVQVVVSQ